MKKIICKIFGHKYIKLATDSKHPIEKLACLRCYRKFDFDPNIRTPVTVGHIEFDGAVRRRLEE